MSLKNVLLLNQNWLRSELEAAGARIFSVGWVNDSFDLRVERPIAFSEVLRLLPADFTPDVVIYFDDSYPPTVLDLEEAKLPLVFFSVDSHHHHSWHRGFARIFDLCLVAQKDYLGRIQAFGEGSSVDTVVSWFPLWAPRFLQPAEEKTIPVCFRGTLDPTIHPKRVSFFEDLQTQVAVDFQNSPWFEAYPRAKIVVNQTVHGDLNFRVFEALMSGALLITPKISNGLLELFQDGEELVTFTEGNAVEAAQKIRYFLEHESEREAISRSGRQKLLEQHAPKVVGRKLFLMLQGLERRTVSRRFTGAAIAYLNSAASFYSGAILEGTLVQKTPFIRSYLMRGVRALSRAAERGEDSVLDLELTFFLAQALMRDIPIAEEELKLCQCLFEAYPSSPAFGVSLVDYHLRQGEGDRAIEIARSLYGRPEEVVAQAPRVIEEQRKKILNLLPLQFGLRS